jgi:hypothetical protein
MRNLAFRSAVGSLALGVLALGVVACASKTHSKPVDSSIIPKLAGRWTGFVVPASGAAGPADMTIEPNGAYKVSVIQTNISSTGTIGVVDGQLVFNNTGRSGPSQDLALAAGTLDYQESGDGKVISLSGFGHNDRGPFSMSFTKQRQ